MVKEFAGLLAGLTALWYTWIKLKQEMWSGVYGTISKNISF